MDLVIVCGVCVAILNAIPWAYLLYTRPDRVIEEQLVESDQALAHLVQILMHKMENFEDMAENFGSSGGPPDFGSIIGQIIAQKFNPVANDDYMRSDDGTFNGTPKIIEAKDTEIHEH